MKWYWYCYRLAHRIQQPISKLRILNFRKFLTQSDCFWYKNQITNTYTKKTCSIWSKIRVNSNLFFVKTSREQVIYRIFHFKAEATLWNLSKEETLFLGTFFHSNWHTVKDLFTQSSRDSQNLAQTFKLSVLLCNTL